VFRRFVQANRRIASAIEQRLPQRRLDISREYTLTVTRHMRALEPGAIIVDAGGGRRCAVAEGRPAGARIIAVDESAAELALNREVDGTRVADISRALPFADSEIAMVVSKHVLEHLPDTGGFVREAARVLAPGGRLVCFFPARYAPFALLNRIVPVRFRERLLHSLHPETEGTLRFRAYYDRCNASAMAALLASSGFEVEAIVPSYYQSHYFGFFLPLYLASALYELVVATARARDLAANLLVVARKR
jgi:SAM-dependent methyltransferase